VRRRRSPGRRGRGLHRTRTEGLAALGPLPYHSPPHPPQGYQLAPNLIRVVVVRSGVPQSCRWPSTLMLPIRPTPTLTPPSSASLGDTNTWTPPLAPTAIPDIERSELTPVSKLSDEDRGSWGLVRAGLYQLRGDGRRTAVYADSARLALEVQTRAAPDDGQRHALLGLALAYLGRKADAIREGQRGVELMPIRRDAYFGPYNQLQLVRIYLLTGEPDLALDQLEPLLRVPYYLSPGWLRIDPAFDPLRKHPRFQRLLGEPAFTLPPSPTGAGVARWVRPGAPKALHSGDERPAAPGMSGTASGRRCQEASTRKGFADLAGNQGRCGTRRPFCRGNCVPVPPSRGLSSEGSGRGKATPMPG
jgi:hypothetical protein